MTTLLHLDSSLHGGEGRSSQLAREFVGAWQLRQPQRAVIHRDLAADPLPHLDAQTFAAWSKPAPERDAREQALVRRSDELVAELQAADTIVLAVPMYNFGIPSTLKSWIDHVARAGVTFRYGENGPQGLLQGKRAIVFAARGGRYAGTEADTQTPYLKTFLQFIGISDVEFVYAEGLAGQPQKVEIELAEAARAGQRLLAA